jgi:hypothetical protein
MFLVYRGSDEIAAVPEFFPSVGSTSRHMFASADELGPVLPTTLCGETNLDVFPFGDDLTAVSPLSYGAC